MIRVVHGFQDFLKNLEIHILLLFSRMCFHQMRLAADQYAAKPGTPSFLRNLIMKAQQLCFRLSPQTQAQ